VSRSSKLALSLSGLFFGGGLDHAIFIATGSPKTHYGLTVGASGQLAFALLDFGLAALLYRFHDRGSGLTAATGRWPKRS